MNIINQPYSNNLGKAIINNLEKGFKEFNFIVAYAKRSGVQRISPYLKSFKERGGCIKGILGIDQLNTSYEAIKLLHDVCDELFIFHSEASTQTFHPKIYMFQNSSNAWFSIGSSNLTGGGLFSNYELNYIKDLDLSIQESKTELGGINSIFSSYSDLSNPCCLQVNDGLIEDLYSRGYIAKELELIVNQKSIKPTSYSSSSKSKLFGKEKFSAPKITTISQTSTSENNRISIEQSEALNDVENTVLIRHVPKAGDRSKQVHFTIDIKNNYFKLDFDSTIQLQQIQPNSLPSKIEDRVLVFSAKNKNVKVEVSGAAYLDEHYPTDGNRPILVFNKVSDTLFTYSLLLNSDDGYTALNNFLLSLPKTKSLPYKITDIETLISLWPDCPLI